MDERDQLCRDACRGLCDEELRELIQDADECSDGPYADLLTRNIDLRLRVDTLREEVEYLRRALADGGQLRVITIEVGGTANIDGPAPIYQINVMGGTVTMGLDDGSVSTSFHDEPL